MHKIEHPLNKVVTSYFVVFEHITNSKMRLRPGLDFLVESLVTQSAHTVFVPYEEIRHGPSIKDAVSQLPHTLRQRVKIVDRRGRIAEKVDSYLSPVCEEVRKSALILIYNPIRDFLYKLFLASKLNAEADVSQSRYVGNLTEILKNHVKDSEGKARLTQIQGIYNLYEQPVKIEVFTVFLGPSIPTIYDRISDFMDEAAIQELSQTRYLLGIEDRVNQAIAALIGIKKWGRNLLSDPRYKKYFRTASQIIQTASSLADLGLPPADFSDILGSTYNPPLTDLDYFRVRICKEISPKHTANFILPDGATRGISEDYLEHYYSSPSNPPQ